MVRARPAVEELHRYVAPLEGRRGLLRLDFNESTIGPSPHVLTAIRKLDAEAYATYPEYDGLTAAFADYAGLEPSQCAAFNGVDAAIRAIFDAFGQPGETFLTTTPSFGYYRPCALMAEMRVVDVAYAADLSFPWDGIQSELTRQPRLCFLCNPNNPTGTLVPPARIVELALEHPQTLFVVDEVYEPFTGQSVLPRATELPNCIALRSLSKSMGLAALRIGFACGHSEVVERAFRVTGPYDVNQFAVVAARAALADREHVDRYLEEVRLAKDFTREALERMGVPCRGEGGNYLLVWPPRPVGEVEAELRRRGILVRSMAGKPLIDGSFRLSIGTRAQMQRLVEVLAEVLRSGGEAQTPV